MKESESIFASAIPNAMALVDLTVMKPEEAPIFEDAGLRHCFCVLLAAFADQSTANAIMKYAMRLPKVNGAWLAKEIHRRGMDKLLA